jgi:hypothetical protein
MEHRLQLPCPLRALVSTLLLAGCVHPPAAAPLHGLVRDTTGLPIRGARVGIVGTLNEAFTDSLGQYAFDSLPFGTIKVRASHLGYYSVQRDSVEVRRQASTRVDFELRPGAPNKFF